MKRLESSVDEREPASVEPERGLAEQTCALEQTLPLTATASLSIDDTGISVTSPADNPFSPLRSKQPDSKDSVADHAIQNEERSFSPHVITTSMLPSSSSVRWLWLFTFSDSILTCQAESTSILSQAVGQSNSRKVVGL